MGIGDNASWLHRDKHSGDVPVALMTVLKRWLRVRRSFIVQLIALGTFAVALLVLTTGFAPGRFCQSCSAEETVIFSGLSVIVALVFAFFGYWLIVIEHYHSLHGRTPLAQAGVQHVGFRSLLIPRR